MKNTREQLLSETDLLVNKLPDGKLEVRKVILDEDGDPIYRRQVIIPGGVQPDEDERVKVIAQRVHTPTLVTAWWVEERKRQANVER